jgi:hypothetical protein
LQESNSALLPFYPLSGLAKLARLLFGPFRIGHLPTSNASKQSEPTNRTQFKIRHLCASPSWF